jgi:lysophospholipase L1-like esterase
MADPRKRRVPRRIEKKVGIFGHSFVARHQNYYTKKLNEICPNVKFEAHGLRDSGVSWVISELLKIKRGQYDQAIIHAGINEIGAWKEETKEKSFGRIQKKLKRAIKIARNKGMGRILLVEATPWRGYVTWNEDRGGYTLEYNKLLAELAEDADVEVVKLYGLMDSGDGRLKEEYSGDSLHPNIQGLEVIAKAIAESKYPQWIDIGQGYVPLGSKSAKEASKSSETPVEGGGKGKRRRRVVQ